MSLQERCLRATDGLIDRLLCVVGAVLASQAPEFFQQYLQRLGGHLDEARRQLAHFQAIAREAGLTVDQLVDRTAASRDAAVARLSTVISDAGHRVADLQSAHDALLHATVFSRPWVFVHHLDPAIARGTWHVYKPAVPTTIEGLIYAGAGMLLLIALYHGGAKPTGRFIAGRWHKFRHAISTDSPPRPAVSPK